MRGLTIPLMMRHTVGVFQPKVPPMDATLPPSQHEPLLQVLEELRATRQSNLRQGRRLRLLALTLGLMAVLTGWFAYQAHSSAQSSPQPQPSAEARAQQREQLLALLPEDKRQELEQFAHEAEWLGQYLRTLAPDEAGALVALMLFRMAKTMENMGSMERNMRTMSAQMASLPAIVVELNQINAKMSVITHDMDSTLGRAGRMVPWMPFGP